jgi:cation:H+ antiporter
LTFFIIIYGIAVGTTFIHQYSILKTVIAICLLLSYLLYLKKSFSGECAQCEVLDKLYLSRIFKVKTTLTWIIVQALLALAGIVIGAHFFVQYVEDMANHLHIAPLILSIIITPIATELPEKLNSVIWTGRKKDTLALGNISGAMVFQSCFPVAFGIIFTPWNLKGPTLASAIIVLAAALINLIWIKIRNTINPLVLLFDGALYATFLVIIFS